VRHVRVLAKTSNILYIVISFSFSTIARTLLFNGRAASYGLVSGSTLFGSILGDGVSQGFLQQAQRTGSPGQLDDVRVREEVV
jgi:hypothetical protein